MQTQHIYAFAWICLNEIKKTRLAYDNITVQLSKKNTRFQYKLIKKGGRVVSRFTIVDEGYKE